MADELGIVVEDSLSLKDQAAAKALPANNYIGVITAAEKRMSQRGTMYGAITFVISPDQYPADYTEGNPNGAIIVYRRVSLEDHPQARYGCRRFCEAISAPLGKRIDVNEWVGLEAKLEVGEETYEGVTRALIMRVNPG